MSVRQIKEGLDLFAWTHGRYPDASEGLKILSVSRVGEKPILLESYLLDPWQRAFGYRIVNGSATVFSYGSDGLPGGGDDISDTQRPLDCLTGPPAWEDALVWFTIATFVLGLFLVALGWALRSS